VSQLVGTQCPVDASGVPGLAPAAAAVAAVVAAGLAAVAVAVVVAVVATEAAGLTESSTAAAAAAAAAAALGGGSREEGVAAALASCPGGAFAAAADDDDDDGVPESMWSRRSSSDWCACSRISGVGGDSSGDGCFGASALPAVTAAPCGGDVGPVDPLVPPAGAAAAAVKCGEVGVDPPGEPRFDADTLLKGVRSNTPSGTISRPVTGGGDDKGAFPAHPAGAVPSSGAWLAIAGEAGDAPPEPEPDAVRPGPRAAPAPPAGVLAKLRRRRP